MKVYVIDDDPEIVRFLEAVLRASGHEVESHCAAGPALHEIRRFRPDCVITDLQMAEMDGLELCREIRRRPATREAAIAVISAHTAGHWRREAEVMGADGYIAKPLDAATFVTQLSDIVAKKKAAGDLPTALPTFKVGA